MQGKISQLKGEDNEIGDPLESISKEGSSWSGTLSKYVSDNNWNIDSLPSIDKLEIDTLSSYVALLILQEVYL